MDGHVKCRSGEIWIADHLLGPCVWRALVGRPRCWIVPIYLQAASPAGRFLYPQNHFTFERRMRKQQLSLHERLGIPWLAMKQRCFYRIFAFQPTLLVASPRALPSSSVQLSSFIYGFQVKIPGPQPFQAGRTRSIAERVIEVIKHEQVHDKEKTKLPPGGKIAVSPESLHFYKMDAETATVTAHEVGHTRASHGAEMLLQDLCLVIQYIQVVEQPYWIGYFSSLVPKVKMIMKNHYLVIGLPIPPPYVVIGVFSSLLAGLQQVSCRISGTRWKMITSACHQWPLRVAILELHRHSTRS
ncbi:hypothetical protein NL676_034454 [Syzygium grande]|nr:hypothetical protein NL676_034454 [Syzygium grande]